MTSISSSWPRIFRGTVANHTTASNHITGHSMMMVSFGLLAGFFSYLYQISMSMLLTEEQYGTLSSLTALLFIVTVFSPAIMTTVAKMTSKFNAEDNIGGANYFWQYSLKRTIVTSIILFILFSAMCPLISRFLHLDNIAYPMVLFPTMLVVFVLSVNSGTLQGLQRFSPLGFSQAALGLSKVLMGLILIQLGLGIYGGLAAIPLSYCIILLITFFFLRDLRHVTPTKVSFDGLHQYAGTTWLVFFCLMMFTNIDVFLAKHFFSDTVAGNYAAISILGKMAFFAPAGVSIAMFPKTSHLYESDVDHKPVFYKAIFLTLLVSGSIVLVYALFADFITDLLFGDRYALASSYVFRYAAAMATFALALLMARYSLSINQSKVIYPLLVTVVLQLILIYMYHSSINQLVNVMLVTGICCIVFMIPFYYCTPWKSNNSSCQHKTGPEQ